MSTSRAFSEQISEAIGSGRHAAIDGNQLAEATGVMKLLCYVCPTFQAVMSDVHVKKLLSHLSIFK